MAKIGRFRGAAGERKFDGEGRRAAATSGGFLAELLSLF